MCLNTTRTSKHSEAIISPEQWRASDHHQQEHEDYYIYFVLFLPVVTKLGRGNKLLLLLLNPRPDYRRGSSYCCQHGNARSIVIQTA
jgi:hypothetical protein